MDLKQYPFCLCQGVCCSHADEFRQETSFDTEDDLPLQCLAASGAVSSGFETGDDLPLQKFAAPSTRRDATADINNGGEPEYVLLTSTPKAGAAQAKRPADVSKRHSGTGVMSKKKNPRKGKMVRTNESPNESEEEPPG